MEAEFAAIAWREEDDLGGVQGVQDIISVYLWVWGNKWVWGGFKLPNKWVGRVVTVRSGL